MLRLARRSLRFRLSASTASFLTLFLGATILMAFASMLDTSRGDAVDANSKTTLANMATIVGGWSLIIIVFAVASTMTLAVSQRDEEMALLKRVGATPGQLSRMIVGEAATLAMIATFAAIPAAFLGGWLLLDLLERTNQVAPGVGYTFGAIAIGLGFGITVLGATLAGAIGARRANLMLVRKASLAQVIESPRLSKRRVVVATIFLMIGLALAAVTATVFQGTGIDAMQTGGQASIWFAIGLALLSPGLMRQFTARFASVLERFAGASGYLAVHTLRRREREMSGVLMPLILVVGIATATLYLQAIENAASPVAGSTISATEAKNVQTLNFVVVGMISIFVMIMLINSLNAVTTHRRREFGQQRLAGSTPRQVLAMVGLEHAALLVTGILFGTVAALFTVLPYSFARTGAVVPDATIAIYLAVVVVTVTVTIVAALVSARRAIGFGAVNAATD